jgi:fatty-acyl-CoA synthase
MNDTGAGGTSPFRDADDVAAFAATPLEERLAGKDLVARLIEEAQRFGGRTVIHFAPSGTTAGNATEVSLRQLVAGAEATAGRLKALRIGPDDVVASLLTNGPGTIAAAMAAMSCARFAPINIYLAPQQVSKLLLDCRARAVLVPREPPAAVAEALKTLRDEFDTTALSFVEIDVGRVPEADARASPLDRRTLTDVVALFHTGGTTGLPKFVPLTARNLAAGAVISQFAYGYARSDRVLCAMPMFHVGGLFACSLFPLVSGSTVVILNELGYRGDGVVAALPDTIAAREATVVIGPPTVMAQLAQNPPRKGTTPRLRLLVNGAAALPPAVGARLTESIGVPVVEPWGLTEATLAVTSGPRDGKLRPGSVGVALPYCRVKAVRTDHAGKDIGDCAANEIGVLAIDSPMVFGGYLNRPHQDQPFFRGGWLDTGDLGRVDHQGYVWVTGRAKELIKRGGHGIDPGVIEDALMAHEAVALAAAVGKPDPYAGEIPVAYVQFHRERRIAEPDLIAFARERIPERAAVPKEIISLEALPVTAVGKVYKHALRMDITRRVAEECARNAVGPTGRIDVNVESHELHGMQVSIRVPGRNVPAVRDRLAAFAFHAEILAIEGEVAS